MKFSVSALAIAVLLSLPGTSNPQAQSRQGEGPLTNAAVVKLVKAGFKEKTVISIIFARVPNFDLATDRMIELKKNGVSEKIIMAMLSRQEGGDTFDDSWDDTFSGSSPNSSGNSSTGNSAGNTTDIFGNSGGQKSKSKQNNSNGSSDGDTVTTGSATVRILKPPSEAGGGPPKLEKTKSLTNDSIVELVEAGFSEGTIIRRIEQSPVDFDLAAPKIEELRKRRVSDKILAAMKTAMGDESTK